MAEICYGVASETASDVIAVEPNPRSARRRRMEVRRFKFAGAVDTMADSRPKRQKLDQIEIKKEPSPSSSANLDAPEDSRSVDTCPKKEESPSVNIDAVNVSGSADTCPKYGVTSVCGRRRDMEDAVSIRANLANRNLHFFGVFDGHGCSHVAVSCRDRMHEIVSEEVSRVGSDEKWKEVMEESFAKMDAEAEAVAGSGKVNIAAAAAACCKCELQTKKKSDHVGSTAVVAVVGEESVVVANCGDSRAVLCRKGKPVALSSDHKPDRPDELDRIEAAGGRVIYWDGARVFGVLAMSRAIGDSYLKPYVVSEPEVTITERMEEDDCLILASDGLWDVVSNDMACDIAKMCLRGSTPGAAQKACGDAAILLTKLALARQTADNVSVVVVDLRRNKS